MSKISLITASVLGALSVVAASNAFAATMDTENTFCKTGFYAGVQMGHGNTGYDYKHVGLAHDRPGTTTKVDNQGYLVNTQRNNDHQGLTGRALVGYQFNPYFAMEMGFTQFNKSTFNLRQTYLSDTVAQYTNYSNGEITQHAIDLIAKGTMPLPGGFGFDVGAGLAYIAKQTTATHYRIDYNANGTKSIDGIQTSVVKNSQALRPTAVVGANFTPPSSNVSLDVFYQIFAKNRGDIATAQFYGAGISYKFA